MSALALHVVAWPTLGFALLVFGFAPGALLRLIVLLYPRDHPRRRELIGELYRYPRFDRPFWVAQQLETALFEGVPDRLAAWRAKRVVPALLVMGNGGSRSTFVRVRLPAGRTQRDKLARVISRAIRTSATKPTSTVEWLNEWPTAEHPLLPRLFSVTSGESTFAIGFAIVGGPLVEAWEEGIRRHDGDIDVLPSSG
jgi:hypothetical protein